MKSLKFILMLALAATFVACSNSNDDNATSNLGPAPAPIDPTSVTPPPVPDQPDMNAAGVYHYTCPNGCAGGAGSEQPCATCGTTLVHNQAYHAKTNTTTPNTPTPPTTPQESAATNAAGVFHYTCPNGCAGGAAQAQACATCGTMLAHNQAYHAQPQATTPTTPQAAPAGVFHYTCPNGCAGGAAQAQACATCGTMLAHNQAYHNAAPASEGLTPSASGKSPLYINNN